MLKSLALVSLLLTGAIFGFFYAWVCSTMWGLDVADPRVAVPAMQAMNASVRNAVFAPAFFGTPVVLFLTAFFAARQDRVVGGIFAMAGAVYLVGGLILTMAVNVPMNEALAMVELSGDVSEAAAVWADYSPRWQVFNIVRTIASGVALLLVGVGLISLGRMPTGA